MPQRRRTSERFLSFATTTINDLTFKNLGFAFDDELLSRIEDCDNDDDSNLKNNSGHTPLQQHGSGHGSHGHSSHNHSSHGHSSHNHNHNHNGQRNSGRGAAGLGLIGTGSHHDASLCGSLHSHPGHHPNHSNNNNNHNHNHNHSNNHHHSEDGSEILQHQHQQQQQHQEEEDDGDHSTACDRLDKESRKRESRRQLRIAQRENCHVRIIRCVTMWFIVLSTVLVCALVYKTSVLYDYQDFYITYTSYAELIEKDVRWEIIYNAALMKQLGSSVASEIVGSGQKAPFATLPRFEVMGGFTDGLGGIVMASYVPLVHNYEKAAWEDYSVRHQGWIKESAKLRATHTSYQRPWSGTSQQNDNNDNDDDNDNDIIDAASVEHLSEFIEEIPDRVWIWEDNDRIPLEKSSRDDGLMAPLWQTSPAEPSAINVDLLSDPGFAKLYETMMDTEYQTVLSSPPSPAGGLFDWIIGLGDDAHHDRTGEPFACILEPLFANFTSREEALQSNEPPIGLVLGLASYRHLLEGILPAVNNEAGEGLFVVFAGSSDACDATNLTYLLEGGDETTFLGYGDLHDQNYDPYEITFPLELYDNANAKANHHPGVCRYDISIYPTADFFDAHTTNRAFVNTFLVALAFFVTLICFLFYERLVTKREKTKNAALAVVASLFPSNVQDRVLKGVQDGNDGTPDRGNVIASYFPATTILFADIAGFTAWSSTREPEQVFRLLETVYGAMDEIALRRGIFKVETVGDCYVAACGLPEPNEDHAVAITKFARDCQTRMASLSRQLEIALGPDTADLTFRIGLHSGPVTGGVLRGQNARFQLFGDTMNQASRMESTGIKNRIQMSATTAQLLIDSGKGKWIEKRLEKVDVKGKGLQQTYLCRETVHDTKTASVTSKSSGDTERITLHRPSMEITPGLRDSVDRSISNKTQRLVTWNTEVLLRRIRDIVHQRGQSCGGIDTSHNSQNLELSPKVVSQLQRHVQHIASMYRNNPFHNYEHASHVTLSMEKMLSNVRVSDSCCKGGGSDCVSSELSLNRYTNDLSNDPLAQFAVVYSALIHDVDHTGASNAQLIKENDWMAIEYNGKSPAENHAISLAWETLMLPDYADLVECLCPTTPHLERLKQLVTDAVLATDIFDEDLKENRNARWQQVFADSVENPADPDNVDNLRVMVVLDHLIQASDVAHTMQHWHVFIKWNERLFQEMTDAYQKGRLAKDPASFWFDAELNFFDKYVIPLAKKLHDCGVFGVSCYEFLNYAETNRAEWETKGRDLVTEYIRRYKIAHPSPDHEHSSRRRRSMTHHSRDSTPGHSRQPGSGRSAPSKRIAPSRTKSMPVAPKSPKAPMNRAA